MFYEQVPVSEVKRPSSYLTHIATSGWLHKTLWAASGQRGRRTRGAIYDRLHGIRDDSGIPGHYLGTVPFPKSYDVSWKEPKNPSASSRVEERAQELCKSRVLVQVRQG